MSQVQRDPLRNNNQGTGEVQNCACHSVHHPLPHIPPFRRRLCLMVIPLDSIQVAYDPPSEYPDNEQDKSIDGLALVYRSAHDLNRDDVSL